MLTISLAAILAAADADLESSSKHEETKYQWDIQLGFLGGIRDLSAAGFVLRSGDIGAGLSEPFGRAPFTNLRVTGPTWEVRHVQSHVRFTLGVSKPFALFTLDDARSTTNETGTPQVISPRSMSLWDLRVGLGGEYTFGRFTPSFDLVGDVQHASVDLTIDGGAVSYDAWFFAYSLRAGVRMRVGETLFVGVNAEYGLTSTRYGAQIVFGWSFVL